MDDDRDVKRTYKLTEQEVKGVDWLSDETILNKSEVVGRMVRYYLIELREGNLDDPLVTDEMSTRFEDSFESNDEKSLIEKMRRRMGD